jgi:anti-anti-sigma factor
VHFGLSERHDSGLNILRVRGELDILTVPRLAAELNALIRRSDGDVAIDLRGASFIDSAGLHILLNAHRRLSRASRRLSVICRDGPVKRVIELARLLDTLDVVDGVGA